MKTQPKIEIKAENEGLFTQWCKNHGHSGATTACDNEGLASKSAKIRKRAQFSANSKKWDKS